MIMITILDNYNTNDDNNNDIDINIDDASIANKHTVWSYYK